MRVSVAHIGHGWQDIKLASLAHLLSGLGWISLPGRAAASSGGEGRHVHSSSSPPPLLFTLAISFLEGENTPERKYLSKAPTHSEWKHTLPK